MSFSQYRMMLATILHDVPPEMHTTLVGKAMTKEAWDAIKSMCIGDTNVCEAKVQDLLKEFDGIRMRSGETIDELAMHMNGVANNIRTLGESLAAEKVVKKLLQSSCPSTHK